MINKNFNNKKHINADKYIFTLLLLSYIIGICIGSFFVFSDNNNAEFTSEILSKSSFKGLLYFIMALLLKYSGVLSGLLVILPMLLGIHNSAYHCSNLLTNSEFKYKTALTMLKETSIVMLLIFYIIIIINQIINKRYVLKKDVKYFSVYFIAAMMITIIEYLLKITIF